MFFARQSLTFAAIGFQRQNDLEAGLFGKDHLVDIAAACSLVGRREGIFVLTDQFGAFRGGVGGGGNFLAEDNVGRTGGAHDGNLSLRPGKHGIGAQRLAAHADV